MHVLVLSRKSWTALLVFLMAAAFSFGAYGQTLVQTFELIEEFGVAHPIQVVTFDYGTLLDPAKGYYMVGADGKEVPFQQLSDRKIAVRTELPAKARVCFKLMMGKMPAKFSVGVVAKETPTYYEIRNGLTAVRVLQAAGITDRSLAPIQGFMLRNGVWTATGPNRIVQRSSSNLLGSPLTAKAVSTRVVEQGPIQTTVEVTYSYDRPAFNAERGVIPAGPGYLKSRISLQSGQPTILVEEDTDMDLQYYLNFYPEVLQTQGRWRGHAVSNTLFGRDPQPVPTPKPELYDRIRDLTYDQPFLPSYFTGSYQGTNFIKYTPTWDRWIGDTGWYWLVYNAQGGADAPVVGMFSGRAGSALGAGPSGISPWGVPADSTGKRAGGFGLHIQRRGADASLYPRVKLFWALYVGTKGQDLGDPYQVQRVGRQMNLHGGVNLCKVARYQTSYADPAGGYQGMFQAAAALDRVIAKLRTDPSYAAWMYSAEPSSRTLQDMWRDSTGAKATQLAQQTISYATRLLNDLVNGDGVNTSGNSYWHVGLAAMQHAVFFNELMRSNQLSPDLKQRLKAAMVLFANVLYDNDFVPLTNDVGVPQGSANMVSQQLQYRNLFATMLSHHPMMAERIVGISGKVQENISAEVNESGAHRASAHYIAASMGPLLSVAQQLKVNNLGDLFQSDRLKAFARFYLDLLTPPEARFGGLRKLVSIGDGSTEGSELYGQLGTGIATVDPQLSRWLMQAWVDSGKVHNGFHGTTILKIDDALPTEPLQLRSATYPGWGSILRHGSGTTNESVAWLLHGLFYSDHRHYDHGGLALYALGTPLSVDWGSTYTPSTSGPYMHSSVIPESLLPHAWDAANVPLTAGGRAWAETDQAAFQGFLLSTCATGRYSQNGTEWHRTVRMITPQSEYPVVVINDRFSGTGAGAGKVATLNLMAQGPVQSTVGTMDPEVRTWDDVTLKQLPSALPPRNLAAGLSRFNFVGQWGVDFELYTYSPQVQQVTIGNWGHTWHPAAETSQFLKATGRKFEERQHIFRLKGYDNFEMILVPFRKGTRKTGLVVSRSGANTVLKSNSDEMVVGAEHHAYQSVARTLLTTGGTTTVSAYGIQIGGGPVEVVLEGGRAKLTVAGAPGLRTVRLPGTWKVKAPWTYANGVFTLNYAGGAPVTVEFTP